MLTLLDRVHSSRKRWSSPARSAGRGAEAHRGTNTASTGGRPGKYVAAIAAALTAALVSFDAAAQVFHRDFGPVQVTPNFPAMVVFQASCDVVSRGPTATSLRITNAGSVMLPNGHQVGWIVPPSIVTLIVAGNLGMTEVPNQTGVYTLAAPLAPGDSVVVWNAYDAIETDGAWCLTQVP
jgi:hypothetical protein